MDVFLITLPIFAIILIGVVSVRSGYVAGEDVGAVSRVLIRVAVPALIINAVTGSPIGETLNYGFMAAYAIASLGAFLVAFTYVRFVAGGPLTLAAMQGLGASTSNSGFVGFPVAAMVIGETEAAKILAQCMIIENLITIPLALAIGEAGLGDKGGWKSILSTVFRGLAKSPLILSIVVGLAIAAAGIPLPEPISRTISIMAVVAAPLALFVVGGTVARLKPAGTIKPALSVVGFKLVLHPFLVFAALSLTPGIPPVLAGTALIFAASPMLSIFPVLGARYGMELVCATALIFALAGSFVSLNLVLALIAL